MSKYMRDGRRLMAYRAARANFPEVLFEDEHILAIHKPGWLPVHGGANVDPNDTVIGKLSANHSAPSLHLVHRLDSATTGALVMAKSRDVATLLERAFASNLVGKTYLAAVVPEDDRISAHTWKKSGAIESPVGGKAAVTKYDTLKTKQFTAMGKTAHVGVLQLTPVTGRTHQLRIHCAAALGVPILGDTKYGKTRDTGQRELLQELGCVRKTKPPLFLHCQTLKIPFIRETARRLTLEPSLFTRVDAPMPDHFQALLELVGVS